MSLEKNLRNLIRERGTTVVALSEKTQVPLATLKGWLNGKSVRDMLQLKAIADHFKVTLDFLYFGVERKPSFNDYREEINAGQFEVILRKVKHRE